MKLREDKEASCWSGAIVGETKWHPAMAAIGKSFIRATVRSFDLATLSEADAWLEGV